MKEKALEVRMKVRSYIDKETLNLEKQLHVYLDLNQERYQLHSHNGNVTTLYKSISNNNKIK
jgi:hypothetical protein